MNDHCFRQLARELGKGPTRDVRLAGLLPLLARALDTEIALLYRPTNVDGRWQPEFLHASWPGGPIDTLRESLSGLPERWSTFDPARPEPEQRNRVVTLAPADYGPWAQRTFPKLGIAGYHTARMLVCDGSTLLGWVGVVRREAFEPLEVEAFERLAPRLARQLRTERLVDEATLAAPALRAVLDVIASPAFVVGPSGAVRLCNAAGRAALETRGRELRSDLAALGSARSPRRKWQVKPLDVPTFPDLRLCVLEGLPRVDERLAQASERWSLSKREREVLGLLLRGHTNQSIADALGLARRTIEVHVTSIMDKAAVTNRVAIATKVWEQDAA